MFSFQIGLSHHLINNYLSVRMGLENQCYSSTWTWDVRVLHSCRFDEFMPWTIGSWCVAVVMCCITFLARNLLSS